MLMGLMTDLCPFSGSEEEEGISSSIGSCFTTTGPFIPVLRAWRLWDGGVWCPSGVILHMGLWAINMNFSFSFSFSSSAISFCSTDFSSSSSSVSCRSKIKRWSARRTATSIPRRGFKISRLYFTFSNCSKICIGSSKGGETRSSEWFC